MNSGFRTSLSIKNDNLNNINRNDDNNNNDIYYKKDNDDKINNDEIKVRRNKLLLRLLGLVIS